MSQHQSCWRARHDHTRAYLEYLNVRVDRSHEVRGRCKGTGRTVDGDVIRIIEDPKVVETVEGEIQRPSDRVVDRGARILHACGVLRDVATASIGVPGVIGDSQIAVRVERHVFGPGDVLRDRPRD
jgi:hypothetical protein